MMPSCFRGAEETGAEHAERSVKGIGPLLLECPNEPLAFPAARDAATASQTSPEVIVQTCDCLDPSFEGFGPQNSADSATTWGAVACGRV
jgi:hypothetical protein